MTVTWSKINFFFKLTVADGRHVENCFLAITHQLIVRFQRNFVRGSRMLCGLKLRYTANFENPRWGTAPCWKALIRHISVKNCPILMKFSVLHQILYTMTVAWTKIKIFNIQHGGRSSCLKLRIAFWAISRQPIVRFQQTFVRGNRMACRQRPYDKNSNLENPRWRTAAIFKVVKSVYLSEKSSDFDKIWCTTADIAPDDSHMTKIKIKI